MKKIFFFCFLILIHSCTNYTPIFTSNQNNFYIEKIEISNDSKLIRKIIKNLKPYSVENGKQKVLLKLDLNRQENVVMKDAKGDPATYEIRLTLKVDIVTEKGTKKLNFNESFSFNNQSNKFELSQYKENLKKNLTDRIFQKIILNLQTI